MDRIPKAFKLIITIILLTLLMACTEDKDPTNVKKVSGINIDGDWKTDCEYIPEKDIGRILSFNFSKDNLTHKQYYYSDSTCTQFKDSREINGKITHHGTEELTTSLGKTAYEKDFKLDNGVKWESLVALGGDDDNTLYIAISGDGKARPDDITSDNSRKFSKGTVPPPSGHVDIDGTWKMDCLYFADEEVGVIIIFKVSGERFSFRTKFYSDNSCTQLKASVLDEGKVTYGQKITTPSGLTAHEIDLQFTKDDGLYTGKWESLVAREGSSLRLDGDTEGRNRPVDFREAETILFTKQ